jgi:hypothetical protein
MNEISIKNVSTNATAQALSNLGDSKIAMNNDPTFIICGKDDSCSADATEAEEGGGRSEVEAEDGKDSSKSKNKKKKKKNKKKPSSEAVSVCDDDSRSNTGASPPPTSSDHLPQTAAVRYWKPAIKRQVNMIGSGISQLSTQSKSQLQLQLQPPPPSVGSKAKGAAPKAPVFLSAQGGAELDAASRLKLKFGNGKNLVGVGPPKRRVASWLSGAAGGGGGQQELGAGLSGAGAGNRVGADRNSNANSDGGFDALSVSGGTNRMNRKPAPRSNGSNADSSSSPAAATTTGGFAFGFRV